MSSSSSVRSSVTVCKYAKEETANLYMRLLSEHQGHRDPKFTSTNFQVWWDLVYSLPFFLSASNSKLTFFLYTICSERSTGLGKRRRKCSWWFKLRRRIVEEQLCGHRRAFCLEYRHAFYAFAWRAFRKVTKRCESNDGLYLFNKMSLTSVCTGGRNG